MPRTPFSLRSPTYPKCHSFTIKSSLIKILHSSTHVLFLSFITKKSNSIHLDFLLCQNFGFFHFEKFCYTESMSLAQRPHGCIRHHFCIPTHIWMGFFCFLSCIYESLLAIKHIFGIFRGYSCCMHHWESFPDVFNYELCVSNYEQCDVRVGRNHIRVLRHGNQTLYCSIYLIWYKVSEYRSFMCSSPLIVQL